MCVITLATSCLPCVDSVCHHFLSHLLILYVISFPSLSVRCSFTLLSCLYAILPGCLLSVLLMLSSPVCMCCCLVYSSFVLILLLSTYILYVFLMSLRVTLLSFCCVLSTVLSLFSGLRNADGLVLLLCRFEQKGGVLSY